MTERGDAGYTAFVESGWPGYLRLAYLLTGDEHAAEELVQDSLVKLYSHWRRVATYGDPHAYVRRMLSNGNVSRWRRFRREHLVDEIPEPAGAAAAGFDAAREQWPGEGRSEAQDLGRALLLLPPRQRAVVVLRHFEDLSEKETAKLLGCAVGTVKSQNAKGLAALRQHLDRASDPDESRNESRSETRDETRDQARDKTGV